MFRLTALKRGWLDANCILKHGFSTFPQIPSILRDKSLPGHAALFVESNSSPGFRNPNLHPGRLKMSPTDIAFGAASITKQYYEHLYATNTNLCNTTDWAFWQLTSTGKKEEAMKPILQDKDFKNLVRHIEENIGKFSPSEASDILLALLRLSYDQKSPIVHQLLAFINKHIHKMDIHGLATVNGVFFATGPSLNILSVRLILNRLKELLRTPNAIPTNVDSCLALMYIIKGMDRYMSTDMMVECGNFLVHLQNNIPKCFLTVDAIVGLIEVAPRLWAPSDDYIIPARHRVMNIAKQHLLEKISELQPEHLECICYRLHINHLYDENIRRLIDTRVQEIIESEKDPPLRDVISLCGALTERSDPWLIRLVAGHLYKRITNTELDAFNVSSITLALNRVKYASNPKLIEAVQKAMADNAEQLFRFNFSPLFRRITPFIKRYSFHNEEHRKVIATAMMEALKLDGGYALLTETICNSMIFLLSGNGEPMDKKNFEMFVSLIPKMTNGSLYWVINAIQTLQEKHEISPSLHAQLREINQCLYRGILTKVDVSRFRSLYKVLRLLKQSNWVDRKYLPFVHNMIDMHKKWMPATDEFEMKGLIKCCHVISYYDEELCNAITDACLHFSNSYTNLGRLVCFLGAVGYRPENASRLMERMEILIHEDLHRNQMHHYLTTLLASAHMGCDNKEALKELFTKDVLQKVGAFIQANPDRLKAMWGKLMVLNRHVLLVYPELSIPWFCEGIAGQLQQVDASGQNVVSPVLYHEMDTVLKQILHTREYYRPMVTTPYYCKITFECILNRKTEKPVKWTEAPPGHTGDLQRVAIIVASESQHCMMHPESLSPGRLRGAVTLTHRHIEMLGYKLIVVPYYEWNSMALSSIEEKCRYMEQKLFPSSSVSDHNMEDTLGTYASNGQ